MGLGDRSPWIVTLVAVTPWTSCLHTLISSEDIKNSRNFGTTPEVWHHTGSAAMDAGTPLTFSLFLLRLVPSRGAVLPTLRWLVPQSSLEHSHAHTWGLPGDSKPRLVSMRMNHQGPRSPQPFKKDSKPFNTIPHRHSHLELCPQPLRRL